MPSCLEITRHKLTDFGSSAHVNLTFGVEKNTDKSFIDFSNLRTSRAGLSVELTRLICTNLKANCVLTVIDDSSQWYIWEKDSYGSLLGRVFNGTFNATLPLWFYSKERENYFSFTEFGLPLTQYFATRKFDNFGVIEFRALIGSFNWKVWLLIVVAISLVACVVLLCQKTKAFCCTFSFFETLLAISVMLVRKNFPLQQRGTPTKIALLGWGVCALLLTSAYTGGLISAMLKIDSKPPFRDFSSLLDCLREKRCKMIFQTEDPWFQILLKDRSLRFYAIKETFSENPPLQVSSYTDVFEAIKQTSDIFLVSEVMSLLDLRKVGVNTCPLYLVGVSESLRYIFTKSHPYLKQFNRRAKLVEGSGLMTPLIRKYVSLDSPCDVRQKTRANPVPLRFVFGAACVLILGLTLAAILLMLEKLSQYISF